MAMIKFTIQTSLIHIWIHHEVINIWVCRCAWESDQGKVTIDTIMNVNIWKNSCFIHRLSHIWPSDQVTNWKRSIHFYCWSFTSGWWLRFSNKRFVFYCKRKSEKINDYFLHEIWYWYPCWLSFYWWIFLMFCRLSWDIVIVIQDTFCSQDIVKWSLATVQIFPTKII